MLLLLLLLFDERLSPGIVYEPAKGRATSARQYAARVRDDRMVFRAVVYVAFRATLARYTISKVPDRFSLALKTKYIVKFHLSYAITRPGTERSKPSPPKNCSNKCVLEYLAQTDFRSCSIRHPLRIVQNQKATQFLRAMIDLKMS